MIDFIKKHRSKIITSIWVVSLVLGMMLMVYKTNEYQRNWHNVDLAYNFLKDPHKELTIYDSYAPGKMIPMKDIYIANMQQLREANLRIALIAFSIGVDIGVLYYMVFRKKQ